ncbi:MAG: hypothetical protein UY72_C0024G0007 [Candidatus Uhrbacteria bacterium GW2011_GWD2_52_7]|uniref:Fibronectin type-III domain-containing protein n=1 Tax=Candidatus Uhrbacteria bacterium GW2011_GWD2_52_7 TaxID=1618989 RepID=A0A0G1XGM7_9BACT|nr:MAG: hypothetical protein UY72_C0024G0007 [Candidatus Uhrbacteria bacterium GW2011_GWD2_52_7]
MECLVGSYHFEQISMLFRRLAQVCFTLLLFCVFGNIPVHHVHAAAPAVVTVVVPTPADRSVTLTWTNPVSIDFTGTMVRYSTTAFPTNTSDGTLAGDVAGLPALSSSLTVSGLTNGTTYYFSLFSHNVTPEYSAAVNAQQVAMAPVFTEDFESRSLASLHGQNGWTALGGTWTVIDTAGEQTVRSSTDNTIPLETNRVLNGGTVATHSNQMLRVDWKGSTANFPGQLFLRAQSASADAGGYYLWHSSGTLRLSYKTSTGNTTTALATAAYAISTGVWYTYEFSAVNNAQGLPVLSVYLWQRGTAKPSTPTLQFTDTFPRFAQGVFSIGKSGATQAEFDNVAFYGMPGISGVTATPGESSVALSWTNPTYATYTGTMVRMSTSAYPTSTSDGTLVSSVTGSSGSASSVTHSGLTNGTTYYYALFPYDNAGVYGTPSFIRQVAYPSLFSDDFTSRTLGTLAGQNAWTSTGGTWDVVDLSSDRVVQGSSEVAGYSTNKVQNGTASTTDQLLTARFLSDNATNLAGQFWLRQQATAGQGYNFWHTGSTWTISYVDTSLGINDTLAASTSTAGPPMEANVWYNVEASAIDDGSDLPVLTLFVWKDGAEKPAVPTLQVTDSVNHYTMGAFSLGKASTTPYAYYDDVAQYGSAPVLTVTSPAASVAGAPNVATLAIEDEGGTFYIPYIQTSTTLNVAASATSVPVGGGVEFVLNEGLAGEQSTIDLSSAYTASFSSLAKGEYTLDVYVLQSDGVTRYATASSHVERTDIGIGDIITVIGDSITDGSSGTVNSIDVESWLDADAGTVSADNRQFPQHGVNSGSYNEGYFTDLNDKMATYYDYPVFFMNEGVSGIRANNYSTTMNAAWQTRQLALAPNKWIISLGVNDAWNDLAASTVVAPLTSIVNTLISTYGASAANIYLNYPIYDNRTSVNAAVPVDTYLSAYPAVYDTLRADLGLAGGADFYNTFANYYATDYRNLVHPNATGYVRMARLMALAMMSTDITTIDSVTARQATVNWTSISAEEATIVGYRVNYGTSSSALTSSATFGDVTTGVISGLDPNTTYYFSVEAFDNDPYDVSYSDDSPVLSTTTQTIAQLSSAVTADNDGDGYIDRIVATFSKDLDGSTVAAGDFALGSGYVISSASETAAGVVTFVVTEGVTYDTGAVPSLTLSGSISDTFANATTSGSVTPTDGAPARIVSMTPATGSIIGILDQLQLTFTETMDTSTLVYSVGPTVGGLSVAWSASDTVVTISHTSPFTRGITYTFALTGARDLANLSFGGVLTGATNPVSFTIRSSSAATSTGSVITLPSVLVQAPNGGEQFEAGSIQAITWKSDGSSLSAVTLAYSLDSGSTYTTIASNIANVGRYSWTVPSVTSSRARIRVRAGDLVLVLAEDASDDDFSIVRESTQTTDSESQEDASTSDPVVISQPESGPSPFTGLIEAVTPVSFGDYIRGTSFPTVYYIDSTGVRRPFNDSQTFLTYQPDFSNVTIVTDATLPTLTLGAPMPPKAGVVLVKIISDNRVYWVSETDGVSALHWVTSEEVAQASFGERWADYVIDIPPTMMNRFTQGSDIEQSFVVDLDSLRTRSTLVFASMPR